jgi:uncharacterized protein (TIGR00369 family)
MSPEPPPADVDRKPATPDTEMLAVMPNAVALGVQLESATAQQSIGHLDWAPERCTAGGVMHGGALMSLVDSVAAACAFLGLPAGASTATASSTTHLFRAAHAGAGHRYLPLPAPRADLGRHPDRPDGRESSARRAGHPDPSRADIDDAPVGEPAYGAPSWCGPMSEPSWAWVAPPMGGQGEPTSGH